MKKIILHLCADTGSDSYYFQQDKDFEVIKIGSDIGVENYTPPKNVFGVIANPVCDEFSPARGFDKIGDLNKGMFLVNHCLRIIKECNPKFWVLENPARGKLKNCIGKYNHAYQPWEFGSPWTKHTGLWGKFNMPKPIYKRWEDVLKNENLWIRKGRDKPNLIYLHKSAIDNIEEFKKFKDVVHTDKEFRSLCSQGFAKAFYEANKS